MTNDQAETIEIAKTIPHNRADGTFVAGVNYIDDDGRWTVRLDIEDAEGERDVHAHEGDTFAFGGGTWEVTKVYEPTTATRGAVATLTRVQ
ncbi:MAG TPA: DUF6406 domain-containing protein [Actinopolymorphaceae bacterium]